MIKTKIIKSNLNPNSKALVDTPYLEEAVISDKKKYLKDTDYQVIKIAEETARLVEVICEELHIDHSSLSGLLAKYNDNLQERESSRESI